MRRLAAPFGKGWVPWCFKWGTISLISCRSSWVRYPTTKELNWAVRPCGRNIGVITTRKYQVPVNTLPSEAGRNLSRSYCLCFWIDESVNPPRKFDVCLHLPKCLRRGNLWERVVAPWTCALQMRAFEEEVQSFVDKYGWGHHIRKLKGWYQQPLMFTVEYSH